MPDPKGKIDDLELVNMVLKHHPEAAEAVRAVQTVANKVSFPIHSYHELSEAMGGDQTAVTIRGRHMTLAEIQKHVPSYYFPISNVHDLVAKIADLSGLGRAAAVGGHVIGVTHPPIAHAPKPDSVPPEMSGEELAAREGIHAKGEPGIGGIKKP